jgi:hypothetical protein
MSFEILTDELLPAFTLKVDDSLLSKLEDNQKRVLTVD